MVSEAVRIEREKRKSAREAKTWALITDPAVINIGTYLVGLWAIEHIPWSDDKGRNLNMKMLGQTVNAYAALSRAGAKGWPAILGAGAGGLMATGTGAGGSAGTDIDLGRSLTFTGAGAGIGSVVPGVGTAVGAGVGLGIDTILQMIGQ